MDLFPNTSSEQAMKVTLEQYTRHSYEQNY